MYIVLKQTHHFVLNEPISETMLKIRLSTHWL